MPVEYGKGIFRVVGCLKAGFLELEYVGDGKGPLTTKREDGGITIRCADDVWIHEVPVEVVPFESRMPNCLVEVSVRNRTEILSVIPADAPKA